MKKQTAERRLAQAEAQSTVALGLFTQAAASLEAAAEAAEKVSNEALAEIQRLEALDYRADQQARAARAQAAKIREFIQ